MSESSLEFDVVVFGSGAAGLAAALFAAIKGLRVLLCEKASALGGTTASSGGILWIPNSDHAHRAGQTDSTDSVREYLRSELGINYRSDLVEAFIESAPKALALLEAQSEATFNLVPWPDYHPDQPGAALSGRALEPRRYDGRKLGRNFALIQAPYKSLLLFGGMQVDKRKVDDLLNPFRSLATFKRVVATVFRYFVDRLSYPRGTDIGAGNALVAMLVKSLLDRKIEIWTAAPLVELIADDGRVSGAVVTRNGGHRTIKASRGVVLATGGFPNNQTLQQEFSAGFLPEFSFGFPANTGDGILAARKIGARMDQGLSTSAYWTPGSALTVANGRREGVLYGYLDRGRPGIVAVDRHGNRFVNESNSYHDIVLAMWAAGYAEGNFFHFVCDRTFVWHHGLGRIGPFTWSLRRFLDERYITVAGTPEELAGKIGIDVAGLRETIRKHNAYAHAGDDPDFGKGSTAYNKMFAHPRAKPNGNLAPIDTPPYVALRIYPAILGTAVGLDVDADGRVMNSIGKPITGLYACGNDMASMTRGNYPAGGITLGPGIAFAYRIASHAASTHP